MGDQRARKARPPFSTSGPGLYVETGLAPARFHPKDAQKGFRPAGQNPSGTGTGVERPLIRHGIRRDTFPPVGGRLFGRLEAAPAGSLRPLRRGALCAPAVPMSGPRLCAGTGPRPARPIDAGRGKEAPSSVAAYAATPSPQEGGRLLGGCGIRWAPLSRGERLWAAVCRAAAPYTQYRYVSSSVRPTRKSMVTP